MSDQGHDRTRRQTGEEIAEPVGDPERLLHGEDPHTAYVDDARHWRGVYEELLAFKMEALEATRRRLETLSPSAREDILGIDLPVLQAEADRLHARHEFWDRRVAELGG